MDNYKKKLDEIHAPESLITLTLNRIHEQEQLPTKSSVLQPEFKKGHRKKWNQRFGAIGALAAAAVLFWVVGVSGFNTGRMELIYNTVPETIVRSTLGEKMEGDVEIDAFNAYLGVDITCPVENAKLIKAELYMEREGQKVISDEACVYYDVDGEQLMIRYSKSLDVVPSQLKAGEASEVNGRKILAGVSENGKERLVAFECEGIRYFIMSNSMDQKTFESFLDDFLGNLSKGTKK